ncbi:hypothetical protein FRC12_002290 [Ceratobasidium sp. 428]|nr:hypothetical protein FRC12_002290 [Ceratobasidium sp. 428]
MPRSSKIQRAARRTLMMVNGDFHLLEEYETHNSYYSCPYCHHPFDDDTIRNRHIMAKPECRARHMHFRESGREARRDQLRKIPGPSSRPHPMASGSGVDGPIDTNGTPLRYNDPRRWTDNGRTCQKPFVERFPVATAGSPISEERACLRDLTTYLESCGKLASQECMEAAELLMTTGLSGKARTRHLQSRFYKGKTPWANDRQMLIDIDKLPRGASWDAKLILAGEGEWEREEILYKRPVVDVIRDLLGNPAFARFMRYAPEKHWTSRARKSRVYGEMWTGKWWWRRQKWLRDRNGTIVPLIFSSDKTHMSKFSGNQEAYPVYLTIGNISKDIRRQATKHATVIIGYIPVDSFKDVPSKTLRRRFRGELTHFAMASIMAPLKEAGRTGVEMWCADGRLRRVYPMLAAFVGDWPEQNDMACTDRGGCPKCWKRGVGRGDQEPGPRRTSLSTIEAIDRYLETGRVAALEVLGLKRWWPWWAGLPNVEFATCITPDLLHQVHKGVFKDHAMRWFQRTLGKPVMDERYKSMTRAKNLRHFKKGISSVSQWTGREAKEMEKVFVPLLAEHPDLPDDLITFVRSLIDFSYIARAARLTEDELEELREAHATMHRLKQVLVRAKIYKSTDRLANIPKWHMLSHYFDSIRELGTPDGYNTESPEYLHIVYVKRGWEASNKRNAIPQIIEYCQRLEALRIHRAYLNEHHGIEPRGEPVTTAVLFDEDDGEYKPEDNADGEEAWEDVDEGEEDDDGEEGPKRATVAPDANEVHHPWPEFAIAMRPTRHATLSQLVDDYGTTSLERALHSFLRPYARDNTWFLLPHDDFNVWHKLTLYHHPLPFAPDEARQRDVIRVRPALRDQRGRSLLRIEPVFDTALFLHDSSKFGIHRYRAGRVRAILQLPKRLQEMYSGVLAYLELFTPFDAEPAPEHLLHATSHARSGQTRQYAVIPIERIVMGCHLAPNFRYVGPDVRLDARVDLLADTRRFFFNHYYNLFTFQLIRYWRHHRELNAD